MSLFFHLILSLISPGQIFAQATTITPASDKNLTEEVREMVTQKVKEIQQNDPKNSSVSTNIPKAIIGTIGKIENNQITINDGSNSKIITITNETVFIDTKKNKIKIDNLKPGQIILAMGYYDQVNNFESKRIVITTSEAIENKNEIVFGKIADISQTSNVLVLIPLKNKNTQYQIKTDSKTKVIDQDGTVFAVGKLKSGQKVVAIIQPDTKTANTFSVSQIITVDSNPQ